MTRIRPPCRLALCMQAHRLAAGPRLPCSLKRGEEVEPGALSTHQTDRFKGGLKLTRLRAMVANHHSVQDTRVGPGPPMRGLPTGAANGVVSGGHERPPYECYCGLMPAALITFAHFAISDFM